MKRTSILTVIAISILIIVGVVYYYEEIREVKVEIPKTNVVVATKDIPANTVIEEDMITIEQRYTEDLIKQKDILTSHIEKILGKRTRVPLYKNEEIVLNRLIENKPYMNDDYSKRQIEIALYSTDKALNIKEGSFIDVWLEPTKEGLKKQEELNATTNVPEEQKIKTKKILEKIQIATVDNPNLEEITEKTRQEQSKQSQKVSSSRDNDPKRNAPAYISVELSDENIAKILDVDDRYYQFRITLYSENKEYELVGELIEKKEAENKEEDNEDADKNKVNEN